MPDFKKIIERLKQLPVVREVVLVLERYGSDRAGLFADALTYQAFFSIFPMLLVASSVIGFVLDDPQTRAEVIAELTQVIPGFGGILGDTIQGVVASRGVTGILGLAGMAWRGTALVRSAGTAVMAVKRMDPDASPARKILWAFGAAMTLSLFGVGAIALGVLGSVLPGGSVTSILMFILAIGVDLALFLVAYRVLTPGAGPPFRVLWPGALVAAAGWSALKAAGSFLAQRALSNATAVYGSLALAVGMLIVLSLAARLFMYGVVVNALYVEGRFRAARTGTEATRRV